MKKKILACMLIGALICVPMSGCAKNGETKEKAETKKEVVEETDGTVELTVWSEEANFEMLNKMIDSFKKEYAGQAEFNISLVDQADAKTKDTLFEDVHAAADVFSMPDDQLLGMIAAGALAPVEDAETVKAENLDEAVDAASYNGTLYAYPYTADNGYFLYYDKNYFTEEDVKTLDGILAVTSQAGKKFEMEFNSGWYMYAFFGGTGLQFGLNDDGVTNYCTWNSTEGSIKGTDIGEALMSFATNPSLLCQSDDDFVASIKSGDVIAGISGVWNAIGVKEAWGEDYGACKLPTYTCAGQQVQMSSFTGYKMMGVNAYSEEPEWAQKLAAWFTNEENQTIRFEERNQGPSNKKAAASDAVSEVPAIQAVIEQSQYGNLQRVGGNFWDPCTEYANKLLAGNVEGKTTQELLDELVAGITASTVK